MSHSEGSRLGELPARMRPSDLTETDPPDGTTSVEEDRGLESTP